jgi:hypothetical protein
MAGHAVYRPERGHACQPGVTYRQWPEDGDIPPPFVGARLVDMPQVRDYPHGTVWECECRTTWVSRGAAPMSANMHIAAGSRGVLWKRESRRARRKRETAEVVRPCTTGADHLFDAFDHIKGVYNGGRVIQ